MKTCEICGGEFKNLGAHMRKHKGEKSAVQVEDAKQEVPPKIPRWRLKTPVFSDGQAGIKIPRAKLERGWK